MERQIIIDEETHAKLGRLARQYGATYGQVVAALVAGHEAMEPWLRARDEVLGRDPVQDSVDPAGH